MCAKQWKVFNTQNLGHTAVNRVAHISTNKQTVQVIFDTNSRLISTVNIV